MSGPTNMPVGPSDVRAFYDEFTEVRTMAYPEEGNLRIRKALERLLPHVRPGSSILEIGCGRGIVTQRVAKTQGVKVWACDISETAVSHARQLLTESNLELFVCDVVNGFDLLSSRITRPIDLVLLVDVIEHIPLGQHRRVFKNLRSVMDAEAHIVVTLPSPQYQRHLRESNPSELQIIDEVVEFDHLLEVASETGLFVEHYSMEDVWLKNQYVHYVLSTDTSLRPLGETHERERWWDDVRLASREIAAVIPPEHTFILVDDGQWIDAALHPGRAIPFLERDGQYWGPPGDDETAIRELERLRADGACFIVFGWPAFWWLDYYAEFLQYLRTVYSIVRENERLLAFDLCRR